MIVTVVNYQKEHYHNISSQNVRKSVKHFDLRMTTNYYN